MATDDPQILTVLVQLRKAAGLNQAEAGTRLGLTGEKRRSTVSDWETRKSQPSIKHRADFVGYLLDALLLRRDPERMASVWTDIMVEIWGWKPLNKDDLRRYYPGGIPPVLLPKELGSQQLMSSVIHEPLAPASPPNVDRLVDRTEKLAAYSGQLIEKHLAVIVGMPGIGKTSLASMLVQQTAQPKLLFWHTFRDDRDATNLMWKLAGFLYRAGEEWPWLWLQNASQSHGQPLDPTTLVDTLVNLMLKRGYTVCLDDFQQVETDPLAQAFGRRLVAAAQADTLSLVVTARSLPGFLQGVDFESLGGMSQQEAKQLFIERKMPPLGGDLLERLHNCTGGNPQLLELVIVAIRQGEDPEHLVNALTERQAVAEYLFDQVDSRLDKLDRQVMIAVALLEPAATRGAIEAVLPSQSVFQSLVRLGRQQLLQSEQQETGQTYHQHATVRAYYLQATSVLERQQLHYQAGDYFEREARDWLYAASHFLEAREDHHGRLTWRRWTYGGSLTRAAPAR